MKQSLRGHELPETHEEAAALAAKGQQMFRRCIMCHRDLAAADAASSPNGWKETQISGSCKPCFDSLFGGMDE